MRKLLVALFCAALLLPAVLVAPVAVSAANPDNCSNATAYNDHANINIPQIGTNIRGIRAVMYAPYRIDDCIDSFPGTDLASGPSYWVALTGPSNNSEAIIQIGVIRCQDIIYSVCTGGARLFYADGGCANLAVPEDLGLPPSSGAEFTIERRSNGFYYFLVDGVVRRTIWKGDGAIDCWADFGPVHADIACERWDSGDMCGSSLDKVSAHGIKAQKSVQGTWWNPNLTAGNCSESNAETQCSVVDTDSANYWTSQ